VVDTTAIVAFLFATVQKMDGRIQELERRLQGYDAPGVKE